MPRKILIVDDERGVREALSLLLEERGYEPLTAEGGEAALALLEREEALLVLSDVAMPGMDGISLVERLHKNRPELPVIMISAHGDLETAVRAVRAGAYDYLLKPVEEERLFHTMERALEFSRLRSDYGVLREEASGDLEMVGQSGAMKRLREEIERAAPSESRILILGENGTGKEMVARLIHEKSRRRDRAFVKVNSAAIPKDLIESELFGHEAGAFTGATKPRKGKFEQADGGTLFLDEIGDMAPDAQAKLLRVLSTGELERVGGSRSIPFDVRLLAASNRDLPEEIRQGRFREDLFHRISVIPIRVPALRERERDVELLAEHFLKQFSAAVGRAVPRLQPEAKALLLRHRWPGNVRELRNLMERISIMHPGGSLSGTELESFLGWPPTSASRAGVKEEGESGPGKAGGSRSGARTEKLKALLREEERDMIRVVLEECGWNVSLAAQKLGIDRASLHRKMRRLGIDRPGRG